MNNFDLTKFLAEGKLLKENLSSRAKELEMDFMDPRNKFGDEWQEQVSNVLVRKYDGHWENWENENPKELEMLLNKFKNLAEGKLLKEDTGVDMILSPDQIKRYARMKTVGNISDPELISKVIEIISDLLPQNPNISKEELANQFGEDVVQKTTQILFSAYLDGYSNKAGNLPLVKDYISIFTQMADDERDEELAEGRVLK